MTDKRDCFGKMGTYNINHCVTCPDRIECWNKTYEELRKVPPEPEKEEDAGTIAR